MAELKIKVTAETQQAAKAVESLTKKTATAAATASHSLNTLSKSSGQATFAVLNLGRVAQDSSFGIMGVANNIEPLIQSLGALKAASGGAKGAFASFFGALAGPAGIGVLIGVVQLFDAYSKGYGVFAGRAKKATDEQKKFNEELSEARAVAIKAGIQLQALAQIAGDSSKTDKIRTEALRQINDETNKYGITITRAGIASGQAAKEIDKLTASLVQQAVAARFAEKVADLKVREAELSKKVAENTRGEAEAKNALLNLDRRKADQALIAQQVELSAIKDSKSKKQASEDLAAVQKELAGTEALYKTALVGSLEVSEKTTKGTQKLVTEQEALAAAFERAVGPQVTAIAGYQSLNSIMPEVTAELKRLNAEKEKEIALNKTAKALELIKGGTAQISTAGKGPAQAAADAMAANNEKLKNSFQEMGVVASFAIEQIPDLFNAAFQSISQGESPIKAITNSLKALIVRLAAAAAAAALLSLFLGGATGGAGAAGAAGGGKFASMFGQLLGFKLPGMAKGGIAMGPTPAIVGDGGPEAVIPLSQLHRLLGGRNTGGNTSVTGTIRGSDIYLTNKRGGDSYARLFG